MQKKKFSILLIAIIATVLIGSVAYAQTANRCNGTVQMMSQSVTITHQCGVPSPIGFLTKQNIGPTGPGEIYITSITPTTLTIASTNPFEHALVGWRIEAD